MTIHHIPADDFHQELYYEALRRLSVRLPLDVYERLAALAARERRSVNAQLITIIEATTKETTK